MRKNPIILDSIVLDAKWALVHFMHNNINRADILVRMLAIDNFYNKNDFGFDLYTEMQHTRSRTNPFMPKHQIDYKDRFCNLITSFENGYNANHPIILNKNKELLDGSHRMALSLYNGINKIPALVYDEDFSVDYSINWFEQNGLSHFIPHIMVKYEEVIKKCKA